MENDQKIYRYQNNETKTRTFNSFNNQEINKTKPNLEGNWRSKGLESINYPTNNSNFTKKNFNDFNQNNNRNYNNTYSSFNQNTVFNK